MRTTIDLDEDLLLIAKQLAEQQRTTMGRVVSKLVRKALEPGETPKVRNGVPLFTPVAGTVKPSLSLINRLRD
jgi:hypothetical protein